jgi:methyl-accepting chemotaxis protein
MMWAWFKENGTGLLAIAAVLTLLFNVVSARIDTKFAAMNQRFDDMNQRFDDLIQSMNQRFDAVDQRFADLIQSTNQRFDAVDQRMDRMTDSIDALRGDLVRLGERVSSNKGALEMLSQHIQRISDAPGGDATP